MSVAILVEFKDSSRNALYIPLATEGTYSSEWVPLAKSQGLSWLPLFQSGTTVSVEDLPTVVNEFRRLRAALASNPRLQFMAERLDVVLERFRDIDSREIAEIFIG